MIAACFVLNNKKQWESWLVAHVRSCVTHFSQSM